ncbi:MAG: ABC-F family ATP-binding cassette domain-containing protein [Lachnospiraceae bacterium]|nr:ABC-F family ATP-binding cassette domain-containing protein [Lachnospiraceae bacterium]
MNILSMDNITKSYGGRLLFDSTSFYLQEGEKVGVIGINGTGKSTLLKMMAGLEELDQGTVTMANHVICSYLPQHPVFEETDTVLKAVLRKCDESDLQRNHVEEKEVQAKTMLTRLGVTDFDALCKTLSGGQRKRLALVAALLAPSDILILDEPTNHLDNEMAAYLEEQLKKRTGAVVMVTHDRYFLDSVSSRIIEIDKGNIYSYQANYSGYLELKAGREEAALASERKRQSILRKELEWVKRGARARTTKQKARLERFEELKNAAGPIADAKVEIGSAASRLGKTTVEISHISKHYDDKVLIDDFSYIFLKNDRIGFIGPNGCGKTTLMKMITGIVEPDSGEIIIGQTVKIGYYAQEIGEAEMPSGQRVIDYIKDVAEYVMTPEGSITASQMLERFLFEGKEQYGLLGKLSGGEKRRLNLLKVLMGAPNVLILDEPTNDLDIATLTVLEDYLDSFQGIVITVSHDRYFLDRIVRRIFAFEEEGKIAQYEGGYTDWQMRMLQKEPDESTPFASAKGKAPAAAGTSADLASTKKNSWKQPDTRLKFSFKEQKDYEVIEDEIADLEEKIENLEDEMNKAATDFVKLNELTKEKELMQRQLEEKMDRWMYLEELKARIDEQGKA